MLDEVRRHVSARARPIVGLVCVGALVAWSTRLEVPTVETVARDLGEASATTVGADAFVWGPSRGALGDLAGRDVFFVGARGPSGLGDVLHARASVTPSGRVLFVHHVEALTDSDEAAEGELVVTPDRVAFVARRDQRPVAVEVAAHGGGERLVVALPRDAERVRWELVADGIVVEVDGVSAIVDDRAEVRPPVLAAARLPDERVVMARSPLGGDARVEPAIATFLPDAPAGAIESSDEAVAFPPGALEGAPPPALRSAVEGGERVRFDGRQFEWSIAPGTRRPRSDTGVRPVRRLEAEDREIARIVWDPPRNGLGSAAMQSADGLFGAAPPGAALLSVDAAGALRVGHVLDERAMQWVVPLAPGGGDEESAWCATSSGDLVWSRGPAAHAKKALPSDCVGALAFGSRSTLEVAPFGERPAGPGVSLSWRSYAPRTAPPRGASWRPLVEAAATPAWAPSAHEVEGLERLGTRVRVRRFAVSRYAWTLRAGVKERAHRKGGTFPSALGADAGRARVAFGMGFGKRRGPRGLRIEGSTGLVFTGRDVVLLAGPGRLELVPAGPAVEEGAEHATALRATLEEGKLLAAARERGPRQLRADLCVRGGELLVAEGEFDSHEATAGVLLDLGCDRAAALDRGSEPRASTRLGAAAADPTDGSSLVGLDVPLRGTVQGPP